jgi:hypothetical protein
VNTFAFIHSTLIGLGLAASCGFRVFVPMLVMSIAVRAGQLELTEGWNWLGSWPALTAFAVATVVEICGYYIPWVDNALDTIQTPAAVVAGIVATAACVSQMNPLLQWSTAIIAGGGIAAAVQTGTVLARGASTAATGGVANFVVATVELFMSVVMSVLAIVLPVLATVVLLVIGCFVARRIWRIRKQRFRERIAKLAAGPYRVIAVRHDLRREVVGRGLTLEEAAAIEGELVTDESVLNFVTEDDTPVEAKHVEP